MRLGGLCLALGLIVPLSAGAQAVEHATTVELAYGRESLSNGSPDWQEAALDVGHRFADRQYLGVSLRQNRRFGLQDNSAWGTYVRPLNERLVATIEGSVSPGAHFLARYTLAGALQYEFAPGWLLHSGVKTAGYENDRVTEGSLRLERYVSDFSWSLAWKPVHGLGRFAQSFEARGAYYYGNRNMVGLIAAAGREATSVAAQEVVLAKVRSLALIGRHQIGANWALTYAISRTKQGDFYTRTGGRLGVQYFF
jgi:YaiO family outer membrane protein